MRKIKIFGCSVNMTPPSYKTKNSKSLRLQNTCRKHSVFLKDTSKQLIYKNVQGNVQCTLYKVIKRYSMHTCVREKGNISNLP